MKGKYLVELCVAIIIALLQIALFIYGQAAYSSALAAGEQFDANKWLTLVFMAFSSVWLLFISLLLVLNAPQRKNGGERAWYIAACIAAALILAAETAAIIFGLTHYVCTAQPVTMDPEQWFISMFSTFACIWGLYIALLLISRGAQNKQDSR